MNKRKSLKDKVTIESLAQMTARGFEQVDKRFEQMDKRLISLTGQVEALVNKISRYAAWSAAPQRWSGAAP